MVYRGDLFQIKAPGYESTALWSTGAGPAGRGPFHITMQTDGNLCIYAVDGGATWVCKEAYDTRGRADAQSRVLHLEDTGKLDMSGVWNSSKGDGYGDVQFERIEYILDHAPKLNTKPFASTSQIGHNFTSTEQIETLTVGHTQTTSSSYKVSTSLKLGTKTTVEAGLPGVVKGNLEVSAEVTTSFEWNKVATETVTVTDAVGIKTPPGKSVQAKRTWMISSFNMPYRAVGKVKFDSYPEMLPVHIEGTYEGVATHDIETWWIEIPPHSRSKAAMVTGAPDDAGQLMVGPDDGNREGWKLLSHITTTGTV